MSDNDLLLTKDLDGTAYAVGIFRDGLLHPIKKTTDTEHVASLFDMGRTLHRGYMPFGVWHPDYGVGFARPQ